MTTFVTFGNATQPFPRLLDAVSTAFDFLPQPVFVQHGSTAMSNPRLIGAPVLPPDDYERKMSNADLVIAHAGAGSILHALSAKKRLIVMPRRKACGEIVDDHQLAFAAALARDGRLSIVDDAATLRAAVLRANPPCRPNPTSDAETFSDRLGRLLREIEEQRQ